MSDGPLLVVGDALLDRDVDGHVDRLCPDAPVPVVDEDSAHVRPGGAALAAALAATDRREVALVTALGSDAAAGELRRALADSGVEVVDLGLAGATPEKVRVRAGGRPLLRLDRGDPPGRIGAMTAAARAAIRWASAILVSDYGRGVAAEPGLRRALARRTGTVPLVWDPHPRGPVPLPGCSLVTPNEREAEQFVRGGPRGSVEAAIVHAVALRLRWRAAAVCVTRGAGGAVLVADGDAPRVLGAAAVLGDACGAGDRFAASVAGRMADGFPIAGAVAHAVAAATRFVAAGGASGGCRHGETSGEADPALGLEAARELTARVRSRGGTVVCAGGCFDLVHSGHVRTLEAARVLGDCLVVCLNSDVSVRRLKGRGRPLVGVHDRAAVLGALRCVDAVVAFDEDTPTSLLSALRPDLWVKGGDYGGAELPEARVLRAWGGRAVVLPYVEGRSTSRLISEALRATG